MAEDIAMGVDIEDEMQIEYYAYQYNPDEDYSKSISFIYQHLRAYLEKNLNYRKKFYLENNLDVNNVEEQDVQMQSYNEISELETSDTAVAETMENCCKSDYWTFDDVVQMCGLTKKQVKKRIKKKGMIVLLLDSEVQENFKKYMPKG